MLKFWVTDIVVNRPLWIQIVGANQVLLDVKLAQDMSTKGKRLTEDDCIKALMLLYKGKVKNFCPLF